jgi:ABC-type transport system involved in cytochrome bd biosynthesis fused ATPase/permease subunit
MTHVNPLFSMFLTALLRHGLQFVSGYFVAKGILQPDQADELVVGICVSVVAIAWALWVKYRERLKFVTAQSSDRVLTERQVEQRIANPAIPNPTLTLDKDARPAAPII